MAKGGQGKGGSAQMSQPPITKYRKHIGTYQKEKTQKVAKRDFRDKADARKGKRLESEIIKTFVEVRLVLLFYAKHDNSPLVPYYFRSYERRSPHKYFEIRWWYFFPLDCIVWSFILFDSKMNTPKKSKI